MSIKKCKCCCSENVKSQDSHCPECGKTGPQVPDETLAALLTTQALDRKLPMSYHLCETPDCTIIYFCADSTSRFMRSDIVVRVGYKEVEEPHMLCYCFGHSCESIREEWEQTAKITTIEQIETAMRNEGCNCKIKNPQGSCCLPQVRQFIVELEKHTS